MPTSPHIDTTTLAASDAQAITATRILDTVATVRWSIDRNRVTYEKADSHTLSLYLSGGQTSHRADRPGVTGGPGLLCMMPQGQETRWSINGPIEFAHLYVTDDMLRQYGARHFDCDARRIDLQETVYAYDPAMTRLLGCYFTLSETPGAHPALLGEEILFGILDRLVTRYNGYEQTPVAVTGGLSTHHRRKVRDLINSALDTPLSIAKLAAAVGLSPHHFARMFKESFGVSPAQYILQARINRAKRLLQGQDTLASIAAQTGFSQQSHMTMQFKRATGVTPAQYRQVMREA